MDANEYSAAVAFLKFGTIPATLHSWNRQNWKRGIQSQGNIESSAQNPWSNGQNNGGSFGGQTRGSATIACRNTPFVCSSRKRSNASLDQQDALLEGNEDWYWSFSGSMREMFNFQAISFAATTSPDPSKQTPRTCHVWSHRDEHRPKEWRAIYSSGHRHLHKICLFRSAVSYLPVR